MKTTMTCLALLIMNCMYAQTAQSTLPGWHFGIKGDLNMSNIKGNGMANGYVAGVQVGGYAERVLNANWSIQPELLFTQNNSKKGSDFLTYYNDNIGNPFSSDNIKLGYISVPVMVKYNYNKYLSVLVGPQYSMLMVDAESLLTAGDGKAFKKSEFSANAGAQFNLGSVSLYGRYNLGLSNINNIDSRYTWKSNHIQIGLAIRVK